MELCKNCGTRPQEVGTLCRECNREALKREFTRSRRARRYTARALEDSGELINDTFRGIARLIKPR